MFLNIGYKNKTITVVSVSFCCTNPTLLPSKSLNRSPRDCRTIVEIYRFQWEHCLYFVVEFSDKLSSYKYTIIDHSKTKMEEEPA